uniref:Putative secreted protein n=1 Tax=Panstrongylus lignarius TaxID=156445 RepID=A0A224Y6Z3_9HEMI
MCLFSLHIFPHIRFLSHLLLTFFPISSEIPPSASLQRRPFLSGFLHYIVFSNCIQNGETRPLNVLNVI